MNIRLRFDPTEEQRVFVRVPASKSVAARALILSCVYYGSILIAGLPDCDDTAELSAALRQMSENTPGETYNLGSGGTSLRFFLALAASTPGFEGVIDCAEALKRRPLAPLVDALVEAGADIACLGEAGCAPLYVRGKVLDGEGVNVAGNVSSQFVSALMMVSPLWRRPFVYESSVGVSGPYVEMTSRMMRHISELKNTELYRIEPDWSAAGFFYEYALLHPDIELDLGYLEDARHSLQGDSACEELFGRIGVTTDRCAEGRCVIKGDSERIASIRDSGGIISMDMNGTPDLVPALATGLCLSGIRFRFYGVGHLRHKESDRLHALSLELGKAGYVLEVKEDEIAWSGETRSVEGFCFDSHGDHRIAMSLAMSAVRLGEICIAGAEAVSKSFPGFFDEIERIGIKRVCGVSNIFNSYLTNL